MAATAPTETTRASSGSSGGALCVAVLGLGMLFGFMWSSRAVGAAVAEWQVFVTRFATMGTFVALAVAFKDRRPDPRVLLLAAGACLVGHFVCDALLARVLTSPSELVALGAVSVVFEGVALAVMQMLYLEAAALSGGVGRGIAAVVTAYLVAELVYFALLLIPGGLVPAVALAGEATCLAALAWLRFKGTLPAPSEAPRTVPAPSQPRYRLGGAPLAAVLTFICALTLAWGLFAQMTGEGAYAFFDTTSEIAMVAVRLLLVAVGVQVGRTVSFEKLAVLLAMVWATGILVVGLLWGAIAPSTSALVIKGGLYALQAFSLVLVVRATAQNPGDFYYVGGLVMASLMGAHASRLAMLLVFANAPVMGDAAVGVVALGSWFVAAALAVPLVLLLRQPAQSDASRDPSPTFALPELGRRNLEFYDRFERFCLAHDLSERERDVLLETLHGYTVDAVGEKLGLSRETVKTYLSRIYSRAGVGGRQELLLALDTE